MIFHVLFLIRMVWRNGSRELLSLPSGCCFYAQNGSSGGGAGVYWTSCRQKGCRYVKKVGSFLYNGEEIWDFFVSIASFVFFGGMAGWVQFPGGSIWYAFRIQNIIRQSSAFIHNMCLKFTVLKRRFPHVFLGCQQNVKVSITLSCRNFTPPQLKTTFHGGFLEGRCCSMPRQEIWLL